MTTILRSSKYIRCLNVFTRRIIVSRDNSVFVNKKRLDLQLAQCANSYLSKGYATIPAVQRKQNAHSFEQTFEKLDENIQRYGRIFKVEVENVLSKVRETGHISSLDALLMIRCCGNLLVDVVPAERNNLLNEILTTLDALNVPTDVSHFNAILRVYLENDYEFSPISFLTTMRDKGTEPNRITYQRLILHHCKKGDIAGATKILEFMREKEIPLNEGVFSALIIGHSEANDLESAKNVVNVMKQAGVEPSASTYTALMKAYAKRGDMASIKQTLSTCNQMNMYFQDNDYFGLINTLAANNQTDKVEEILALMPKGPNYNLDAAHAILKVLDVGNIQVALKILPTLRKSKRMEEEASSENTNGTFLIRKLVNSNYPAEDVIEACEVMQRRGQNILAFSIALQRSLSNKNIPLSLALLESWKKNSGEIREHYFWPLLVAYGETSNYQGILDVVKIMTTEYNIIPGIETIKDYVLPFTVGKWDDIVASFKELRISHDVLVASIASRMLADFKSRKAATFMLNYSAKYNPEHFYRPLAEATRATTDAHSFALVLRILASDPENSNNCNVQVVDNALNQLLLTIPIMKYQIVQDVLEQLVNVGLTISPETGAAIRQYLADNVDPVTDERIEKLISGSLTPVPIAELTPSSGKDDSGTASGQLEGYENRPIFLGKRRELAEAIANRDIGALTKLIEHCESIQFTFSQAASAQIMNVFCSVGDLEKAEKWKNRCQQAYPDMVFDVQKTCAYATLLIKNARLDDAVNFIKEAPRNNSLENYPPSSRGLIKATLDTMADTGDVEKTTELFNAFLDSNYFAVDNFMLGPLVKVHLNRKDLAGALTAFEAACIQHRCTPMKNELSKKFIDAEDADALQKLTDLSTQVHGESNSLIDLVLAFVECGRLRQARKILETPGLRLRGRKLVTIVDRYIDEGASDYLEQFVDLTKGLPVIDRQEFYDVLIAAHNRKNNWQRGLNLWTTIQEEDIQPTNNFLRSLADVLKRNGQPIPFAFEAHTDVDDNELIQSDGATEKRGLVEFYRHVQNKDLEKAEKTLKNVATDHPEFSSAVSALVMAYLTEENDTKKAIALAEESILSHGRVPRAHALKAIWLALLEAEDFHKLRKHGNILSNAIKRKLRFSKYLCRAEMKQLGLNKFLENLEQKLETSTKNHLDIIRDGIHFSSLIEEFKKDPSAVDRFVKLAEKLAAENIYSPINLVWCYYFERNLPEAEAIWAKYLNDANHVMFKYILNASRRDNNVELAERLFEKVKSNKGVTENTTVFLLTNVVDLLLANEKLDEALKMVKPLPPAMINQWSKMHPISFKKFQDAIADAGKTMPSSSTEQSTAAAMTP